MMVRTKGMIKVRIWRDHYYPCGYQIQAVRDDITDRFMEVLKDTYDPNPDRMAVIDEWNILESLTDRMTPQAMKDLLRDNEVVILMDPWILGHFHGWDAHTAME